MPVHYSLSSDLDSEYRRHKRPATRLLVSPSITAQRHTARCTNHRERCKLSNSVQQLLLYHREMSGDGCDWGWTVFHRQKHTIECIAKRSQPFTVRRRLCGSCVTVNVKMSLPHSPIYRKHPKRTSRTHAVSCSVKNSLNYNLSSSLAQNSAARERGGSRTTARTRRAWHCNGTMVRYAARCRILADPPRAFFTPFCRAALDTLGRVGGEIEKDLWSRPQWASEHRTGIRCKVVKLAQRKRFPPETVSSHSGHRAYHVMLLVDWFICTDLPFKWQSSFAPLLLMIAYFFVPDGYFSGFWEAIRLGALDRGCSWRFGFLL